MAVAAPTKFRALEELMPFNVIAAERRVEFITARSDLDFDRPFWHITMEALDAADKAGELDKVAVSFDELRELVRDHQPRPTGMIFHIGRCGSTLVSRMVGHDPGRLVLREAGPVGGLHRASGGTDHVPTFTIEQAFKDTLVAFDLFAASRGQQVIVKHSSWESFSMQRVAELLPDTPFVFVYRNPIDTVESSLHGHPGWAPRMHRPLSELQRWVPWLSRRTPPYTAAEIYASVWAAGADAALRLPPERLLLIEHGALTAEPAQHVQLLANHLSLELDTESALGELGHYSKAKADGTTFDPSGSHAHPKLSARTRSEVLDVVGDLPDRLLDRLTQQQAKASND